MNEKTKAILEHDRAGIHGATIADYERALAMDGMRVVADTDLIIRLVRESIIDAHYALMDAILFQNRELVAIMRDDFRATVEREEISRMCELAREPRQRDFVIERLREYGFLSEENAAKLKKGEQI